MKAAKEAEAMGTELSFKITKIRLENQSQSMYGTIKENNQPLPNFGWEKTLYDAQIFDKLDPKHGNMKDRTLQDYVNRGISLLHTSSYHHGQAVRCISMAAFCMPFLAVALVLASTESIKKQWKSGDQYHISQHSTNSLCLLQRFLQKSGILNWSIMFPVQTPVYWSSERPFIEIQPCECDKEEWMETLRSTMLPVPLNWD